MKKLNKVKLFLTNSGYKDDIDYMPDKNTVAMSKIQQSKYFDGIIKIVFILSETKVIDNFLDIVGIFRNEYSKNAFIENYSLMNKHLERINEIYEN